MFRSTQTERQPLAWRLRKGAALVAACVPLASCTTPARQGPLDSGLAEGATGDYEPSKYAAPYTSLPVPLHPGMVWEVQFDHDAYKLPQLTAGDLRLPENARLWKCRFGSVHVEPVTLLSIPAKTHYEVTRPIACSSDGWKTYVEAIASGGRGAEIVLRGAPIDGGTAIRIGLYAFDSD